MNLSLFTRRVNLTVWIIFLFTVSSAFPTYSYSIKSEDVRVNTSNFSRNLSSADTDVQKALDTLDDLDASGGSGTPGGSDTQLQYNDSSEFGGIANTTYTKASGDFTWSTGSFVFDGMDSFLTGIPIQFGDATAYITQDISGNLSFTDAITGTKTLAELAAGGGGTPGGNDTYVQFNDGGAFGGEAAFVYDKNTNTLLSDKVAIGNTSTYLSKNVGNDLVLTDANSGSATLARLLDPESDMYGFSGSIWEYIASTSNALHVSLPAAQISTLTPLSSVGVNNFPSEYPLPAAQISTLTPPPAITNFANETGGNLATLAGKDFATQTTLALIKAKTDNIDVALSTKALESGGNLATIAGKDFATQTTLALIAGYTDGVEALITLTNGYVDGIEGLLTTLNGYVDGIEGLIGTTNTNTGNTATSVSSLDTKMGEVQATPTANTLLGRLKNIYDAVFTTVAGKLDTIITNTSTRFIPIPFRRTSSDVDNSAVLVYDTDNASNSGVEYVEITNSGTGILFCEELNNTPTTVIHSFALAQDERSEKIWVKYLAATDTTYDIYCIRAAAQTNDDAVVYYFKAR